MQEGFEEQGWELLGRQKQNCSPQRLACFSRPASSLVLPPTSTEKEIGRYSFGLGWGDSPGCTLLASQALAVFASPEPMFLLHLFTSQGNTLVIQELVR